MSAGAPPRQAHAKLAPAKTEGRPVQKMQPTGTGRQAPAQGQPPAASQAPQPMGPPAPPPASAPAARANADRRRCSTSSAHPSSKSTASLDRHDLTDADLQDLRQQIDPISTAVSDALGRLTPRLAGIKTRLDQLGPNRTIPRRLKARRSHRIAPTSKNSIMTPTSF